MIDLFVVGTVAYDGIETPSAKAERLLGGSATYFALAARWLTRVGLIAVVGDDFAAVDNQALEQSGIDLTGLSRIRGSTFSWRGRYHDDMNGRDSLETSLGVLTEFKPVIPERYRHCRVLFLGNLDPRLQASVLDQVDRPLLVGLDTMNYWIESQPDALRAVLKRVDLLSISDQEVRLLTGERHLVRAAECAAKLGPRIVVIKRGEFGVMLVMHGRIFYLPAFPVDAVIDPTGAGDAFAGAMMAYLVQATELTEVMARQAIALASVLASFVVEDFGTYRLRALSAADLNRRLRQFIDMIRFEPPDFQWTLRDV